jgi:hypothetical protein
LSSAAMVELALGLAHAAAPDLAETLTAGRQAGCGERRARVGWCHTASLTAVHVCTGIASVSCRWCTRACTASCSAKCPACSARRPSRGRTGCSPAPSGRRWSCPSCRPGWTSTALAKTGGAPARRSVCALGTGCVQPVPYTCVRLWHPQAFVQEVAWAAHLGCSAVLFPPPDARSISYGPALLAAASALPSAQMWVHVPLLAPAPPTAADAVRLRSCFLPLVPLYIHTHPPL